MYFDVFLRIPAAAGAFRGCVFRENWPKCMALPAKNVIWEFVRGCWRLPAAAIGCHRQLPEMGSGPAAQTLPSTRAGGQDDVSLEQTPSNDSGHQKYPDILIFCDFVITHGITKIAKGICESNGHLGPRGPRAQVGPDPSGPKPKWDPGPSGTWAQVGPGPSDSQMALVLALAKFRFDKISSHNGGGHDIAQF